jgi:hypothetical protein
MSNLPIMLRVQRSIAGSLAAGIVGIMLGGCSGANVPAWLQTKQSLQFESDPPGAEVRTSNGQTCRTPCSLALPLTAQSANFTLDGYLSQTVPVQVHQSTERLSDNSFPPPDFEPNPVAVTLQTVEKPTEIGKPTQRINSAAKTFRKRPRPSVVTSVPPPPASVPQAPPAPSRSPPAFIPVSPPAPSR